MELHLKKCYCCQQSLLLSNFSKRNSASDGLQSKCRECFKKWHFTNHNERLRKKREYNLRTKDERKIKTHEYYLRNKEKVNQYNKQWAIKNKEKVQKQKQIYQLKNKEKYLENTRRWRKNNPERERLNRQIYTKNRRENDPNFRLKCLLRGSLNAQIRNNGNGQKFVSAIKLLGCSFDEFKRYIEIQFTKNMSWENRESFHLDHITPCCCYDFTNLDDQKRCFKYTNYRPLDPLKNQQKQSHDKRLGYIVKSLPLENKKLIREYIFQNKLKTDNFGETYTHLNNINNQTVKNYRLQDTINNY